ncbi:hypothetical protein POM88_036631 [Heracleum sosnowskyi]|uniref:Uncharacterized protein n=1 Tax=Heracleum sosnowskyi TaxID=360622 RepID=A0AAD8HNP9_9APIA|nr:hypothetical protein POM88_036631 [Heracleum sosnowskyi]
MNELEKQRPEDELVPQMQLVVDTRFSLQRLSTWHGDLMALANPYFKGLTKADREPSCQQISKMEFEFERRRVTKEDIRELIFCEILEYHPLLLKDGLSEWKLKGPILTTRGVLEHIM